MKKLWLPFWLIFFLLFVAACAPGGPQPTRSILVTATDGGSPAPSPTAQEMPTGEAYPPPQATPPEVAYPIPPTATFVPEEPTPTDFPPPTEPPLPTRMPTPDVTPLPTAEPPIIPIPPDYTPEPFAIIYRNEQTLRAVEGDGSNDRLLADIQAQLSLYFVRGLPEVRTWAASSPDGQQLALVLSSMEEAQPGQPEPDVFLYMLDLVTGQFRSLVKDAVEPVWSPDGKQIAYRNVATWGLWVVEVSSGQTREIYTPGNSHYVSSISWSPDGQRLVFVDNLFRESTALVVVNADGSGTLTTLVPAGSPWAYEPEWSPDGSLILFISITGEWTEPAGNYNLWVTTPDGTNKTQLTYGINSSEAHWSPDGNWILFTGSAPYEELQPLTDLWLVDKTGTELKRLTAGAPNDLDAFWSPDGTRIVFTQAMEGSRIPLILSLIDGVQTELTSATADFVVLP